MTKRGMTRGRTTGMEMATLLNAVHSRVRATCDDPHREGEVDQVGTPFEHSRQIMTTLRAYRDASVLMTFAELGIGDILADGPRTADEVAAQAGTDAAATRRLLEAGVALGLLTREGDAYANTQMAAD